MAIAISEHLSRISPEKIPSSTKFPIEKMMRYMPNHFYMDLKENLQSSGRGVVWDIGCGSGASLDLLDFCGFAGWGLDVNENAVDQVNGKKDRFANRSDITTFGDGMGLGFIRWIESVDAMHIEALGPSLLGDSWMRAFNSMDVALSPGGYIFLADFARNDRIYPELLDNHTLLECNAQIVKWTRRMETNMRAFGDLKLNDGQPFPYGAVAVANPGRHKKSYDWNENPVALRHAYDFRDQWPESSIFERFAQNMDIAQLKDYAVGVLGYEVVEWDIVEWPSRTQGDWYPGLVAVLQKPHLFRYHPWKIGLDPRSDDYWETWKARKRAAGPFPTEIDVFVSRFADALQDRDNHQPVVFELVRRLLGKAIETEQKLVSAS